MTDLHDRVGMDRVIGAAARAARSPLVLNAGDTTMHGTRPEGWFVRALARSLPPGTTMLAIGGNHDSRRTDLQATRAGVRVLAGHAVEAAGLMVLGASDPRLSSLGRPAIAQGGESLDGQARRLAAVAREAAASGHRVDVLLVHDPYVAVRVLAAGDVPLALCGHLHVRRGPEAYGGGVLYQGSSTGRDVAQQTLIGPLRNDAEFAVLYADRDRSGAGGRFHAHRLVTIHPDATASVGQLQPLAVSAAGSPCSAQP